MQAVRRHVDKVHVGADGRKGRIPAECFSLFLHIHRFHIVHELYEMPGAGIQEIASLDGRNAMDINHFQPNRPKTVRGLFQNLARMQAVGRTEKVRSFGKLRMTGRPDSQVIGKSDDASPPVSAHHPAGTVRIIELHREIDGGPVIDGISQDHEPIGLEGTAQRFDALLFPEGIDISLAAVDDHEVVPRAGKLIAFRFHGCCF